jgi:hypothetical protein
MSQAKDYAVGAHGTATFPADATSRPVERSSPRSSRTVGSRPSERVEVSPIYSQAQLIIDTGQFIAGSATARRRPRIVGGSRIVAQLVGGSAGPVSSACPTPAGLNYAAARLPTSGDRSL